MNAGGDTTCKLASLSRRELEKLAEDLSVDARNVQRFNYLLMGLLEKALDVDRGKSDGTTVRLIFPLEKLDVLNWLAAEAWSRSIDMTGRLEDLCEQVEIDEVAA